MLQNLQENICVGVSFLIKLRDWEACNVIKKETSNTVFACEFCEIFKSTLFFRTPPVAASDLTKIVILYNDQS